MLIDGNINIFILYQHRHKQFNKIFAETVNHLPINFTDVCCGQNKNWYVEESSDNWRESVILIKIPLYALDTISRI